MAERKEITRLHVITDTDESYDRIGDIDGGVFDDSWLEQYIQSHGTERLIERLAAMQMQVLSKKHELLRKTDGADQAMTEVTRL